MPIDAIRSLMLAAIAAGLATLMVATAAARAQEKPRMERTITVSATGTVAAEPDTAVVATGVVSEAETAREALTRISAVMRKVIDGLKGAGIEAKDIQTVHFGIEPRYVHVKDQQPRITGYRVYNSIRITAREIKRVGEVLDGVVMLGANQAGGTTFEVSKAETLKDEARLKAMDNALRRAKLLAGAAGASIGPVVAIAEEVHGPVLRPLPAGRMAMSVEAVPVEAGSRRSRCASL
jgi:hypothetical protein